MDIKANDLLNKLRFINWDVLDLLKSYSQKTLSIEEYKKKLNIVNLLSGPVTEADIQINKIILEGLDRLSNSQKWEFLSEENIKDDKSFKYKSDWIWIIDPLDGTKDFIQNTGEYAVHIALTYKKKIILGTVLIPDKNELWIYQDGIGSWCESRNGEKLRFQRRQTKNLNEMIIVTSRNHCPPSLNKIINKLNPKKVIGMGSVGYKVTAILRGEADIYISYSDPGQPTPKDWDMAAPSSIIIGYGGHLTDEKGNDLEFLKDNQYRQNEVIIASMNNSHSEICKKIKDLITQD